MHPRKGVRACVAAARAFRSEVTGDIRRYLHEMADGRESRNDWDTCPGCGKRLGQPGWARFDEDGEPVTTPAWHPECVQAHMRRRFEAEPDARVNMYEGPDVGPLSA